jgi:hypothetical protein
MRAGINLMLVYDYFELSNMLHYCVNKSIALSILAHELYTSPTEISNKIVSFVQFKKKSRSKIRKWCEIEKEGGGGRR